MIRRLLVVAVALLVLPALSACSAFSHDNTPYEGFNESQIPVNPFLGTGPYEGVYTGTMTLDRADEDCVGIVDEVGVEIPVTLDVIQAGEIISIQFEDDTEESGKLVDTKVTIVKREASDVRMYHLDFADEAISGQVEVFIDDGADGMFDPCGSYTVSASRG